MTNIGMGLWIACLPLLFGLIRSIMPFTSDAESIEKQMKNAGKWTISLVATMLLGCVFIIAGGVK